MVQPQEILVELHLYNDTLLTGISHLTYKNKMYEHYKISGKINKRDSTIVFTEDSVISFKKLVGDMMCLGRYTVKFISGRDSVRLQGRWSDKKRGFIKCPSVNVWLAKRLNSVRSNAGIVNTYVDKDSALHSRIADVQKVIEIRENEKDSIKVELVDNGEIDNDSVSVFFNDQIVLAKQRISASPISFFLSLPDSGKVHMIKLVAENLGTIPPNTALMIITTKTNRYQIFLTSSKKANAIVEFFFIQ